MRPSRFVRNCMAYLAPPAPLAILDLPVGTGRHAEWLASLGHRLTIADIDPALVRATGERLQALGFPCQSLAFDASASLPLPPASFDLVVVTDFVDAYLLADVGSLLKSGGHLIYESYAARAGNWRRLLPPGQTAALLTPMFAVLKLERTATGPAGYETEAVKLLARRRATLSENDWYHSKTD